MITCESVSYSYDGQTPALSDVCLSIADGEFVCILGGNGSGKSTLAQMFNALLVPDTGTVSVGDMDTGDAHYVYDIRSRVGMVFQNPDDQLVATLVENEVAFGPENLGTAPDEMTRRVEQALREVGLMGFERHETHALSGGQKQRVAIAGVLAMQPRTIVLDEASSMLDPRGRTGLMRVCRELNESGMTVIMITHFMEEAVLADRVIVMNRGRVSTTGTPQEVFSHADALTQLNLELPPACQLSHELARRGIQIAPSVDEDKTAEEVARALNLGSQTPPSAADVLDVHVSKPPLGSDMAPGGSPCITFEHVFYSYESSTRARAERRRKRNGSAQPAWGNDPEAVWALSDVNLSVHRGEFLGIAGHTGSGKSTIIQHMNGIIAPTEGSVRIFGHDTSAKGAVEDAAAKVGVVFQYPEHQLFANTVFEDVAFGPRNLGLGTDQIERRVRHALAQVGLDFDQVAQKSPFELSGGQQRRCAFAGVLAMAPQVLVLDEPAAGLDPAARRDFLDLVSSLHEDGLTVVMVSHSMEDLAERCDRIVVMNRGSIELAGTPQQVFAHAEQLKAIGLGIPAPLRMADKLRRIGVPLASEKLFDMETLADDLACIAHGGE